MKTITLPDGRTLSYELTRKRVKNINFRAKENGIVAVSASARVSIKQIEDLLTERADFFFDAFERLGKRAAESCADFSSSVRFSDRDFPVRVIKNSREIAVFDENELRVFTASEDKNYISLLIKKAVLNRFKALCGELDNEVRETLSKNGFSPPDAVISVKDMKSRWGSCSYTRGRISINLRLYPYPREAALSVFFHEYSHFFHPDHSKAFYDFLLKNCPEYYEYNAMLK